MFKFMRKVFIGLALLVIGGLVFYLANNSGFRRGVSQKVEQTREVFKKDKKQPVWSGTVVVVDALEGDKLVVNTEQTAGVTVRLTGIDAPEMPERFKDNGQPLAEESRQWLSRLTKDKAAEMEIMSTDVAKTPMVLLKVDGVLINEKMVEAGFAEVGEEGLDTVPLRVKFALQNAELTARGQKTNIWGLTNYVRPVEHRIRQHKMPRLAGPR